MWSWKCLISAQWDPLLVLYPMNYEVFWSGSLGTGIVCWVLRLGILLVVPSLGEFPHTPGLSNTLLNTKGDWIFCRPWDFVFSVFLSSSVTVFCECSPTCSSWTLISVFSNKLVHWALVSPLCTMACKLSQNIKLDTPRAHLAASHFSGSFAFMSNVLKLFHTFFSFLLNCFRQEGKPDLLFHLGLRSCLHHPFLCMWFLKEKTGLFVLHSKFG